MKRFLMLLSLLAVVIPAFSQTVIYDAFGTLPGLTFTGSTPRYRMADGMEVLAPTPGLQWELKALDFVLIVSGAQNFADVSVNIQIWDDYSGTPLDANPAFSNLLFNGTVSLGAISTNGTNGFIIPVSFGTPVLLGAGSNNKGVQLEVRGDGVLNNNLTFGIVDLAPLVGGQGGLNDAFYRDANDNGIITRDEARTFGSPRTNDNLALKMYGNLVPEPTTMIALGAGLIGLALRRRKK